MILDLAKAGLMVIVPLSDIQERHFELDDGEAATVAYAIEAGAVALIDGKKGKPDMQEAVSHSSPRVLC